MWHNRTFYRFLMLLIALCAIIAATIWPKKSNDSSPISNGENVSSSNNIDPEIQRLTRDVNVRRDSAEAWDTWNIRFLFIAGFAAVCLVVTAIGVSNSNRSYIRSSDELSKAKDRKLAIDLGSKDTKIAQLEGEASKLTAANLKLEAEITPRRLSDRQQKELSSLSPFTSSLSGFANRSLIEVKSYTSDTEGLILASEILAALEKTKIPVLDNRLTVQPAGSVSFGVSVDGADAQLVAELRKIFSNDGDLNAKSAITLPNRGISSMFGVRQPQVPPAAIITVGPKPIRLK